MPDYSQQGLAEALTEYNYYAICANSGKSVKNLCLLMAKMGAERLKSIPPIVPSRRVVRLADNAFDQATLSALK